MAGEMGMENAAGGLDIGYILRVILRRRWLILVPLLLCTAGGIFYAVKVPKVYEARTLILIDPQRVPQDYVRSLDTTSVENRVNTIQQQILSRTNLEKIIEDFKLFSGPEEQKLYFEEKIAQLRKRISVEVTRASRNAVADSFTISFKGGEPRTVMQITNAIATSFINENLKVREAQAVGTSDFLAEELKAMRGRLEALEAQIKEFRGRYMGELPEQLQSNLKILESMQQQLVDRRQSLREEKASLEDTDRQIAAYRGGDSGVGLNMEKEAVRKDLEAARKLLSELQAKFTESHPDVVGTKRLIADKENELAGLPDSDGAAPAPKETAYSREFIAVLENQKRSRLAVMTLQQEIAELEGQIAQYQARVENTPKLEQELMTLQRDYTNMQELYSSLLNRKLEAEMAANLERKQKGEQFRIVDEAKLPELPVEPDMKKVFLGFLGAGLAIGGGLAFLLEFMRRAFHSPEQVEAFLGLQVLAAIPPILNRRDTQLKKLNLVSSAVCLVAALGLVGAFAYITISGGAEQAVAMVARWWA
jgi:polysaccharide chain length determinant protein (PEP-CTERM system associated)